MTVEITIKSLTMCCRENDTKVINTRYIKYIQRYKKNDDMERFYIWFFGDNEPIEICGADYERVKETMEHDN